MIDPIFPSLANILLHDVLEDYILRLSDTLTESQDTLSIVGKVGLSSSAQGRIYSNLLQGSQQHLQKDWH